MNLKRFIGKLIRARDVVRLKARISYSQSGEDIIIDALFENFKGKEKTYLDIGANDPVICNNTYLLYKKGWRGVLVEPDTAMCEVVKAKRPADTILNIGIGLSNESEAPFYVFPGRLNTWSTFSQEEAGIRETASGIKAKKISVPLKTINNILEQYFVTCPNFISIDVEGLDLDILKSFDFNRFRPDVFCVETISFSINNEGEKLDDVGEFLRSKDYFVYADTHINTIFCNADLFKKNKA
jgi:FkbM family methyltransferase